MSHVICVAGTVCLHFRLFSIIIAGLHFLLDVAAQLKHSAHAALGLAVNWL